MMPASLFARTHSTSSAQIAGAFWASQDLLRRERGELARYGAPLPTLLSPAPVRAGYVVFDDAGFDFCGHGNNEVDGARAFLFLILDKQREAQDIIAWAPQLNRLSAWLNRAWMLAQEAA
ncbi:hypothetical protein [Microvirga sp. BSC39]|uniref:hypothetical protein n=1 Tax=Microvirga sp. BSC39 TaxID=1549810 RepID=UPI0004E87A37|nr:hypothetical protein [Microvirga sp. BSC39]KFG67143.1 hypothetical protein JH26_23925 [Microvirga sp. BSC39]